MIEIFKQLLENEFRENICSPLSDYIELHYLELNLEMKTNTLNDIMSAELYDIEVINAFDFHNEDDEVNFKAFIKAEIELTDYFAGEEITEVVPQWFSLKCIAILDQVEITDIIVEHVRPYNK